MRDLLDEVSGGRDSSHPKERKRLCIVRAATELFVRQGYRGTSVDQIARRAGVAKGTVYLYAARKADLLVQAIAEEKRRYIGRLVPILAGDVPPRERLRQYLRTALVLATEMPLVAKLLSDDLEILEVLDEMDPDHRERTHAMQISFMSELLDEAAAPHRWTAEEIADRAKVVLGFFYCTRALGDDRIRRGLSLERYAGILADMLVDGIAPVAADAARPPLEGGAPRSATPHGHGRPSPPSPAV